MNPIFYLILFFGVFFSCGGLEESPTPHRRSGEPRGEPEPVEIENLEYTSWKDFLDKCKPDIDTPDSTLDVILDVVPGVKKHYAPGRMRACFKKQAQDAHSKICHARTQWEQIRRDPESSAQKTRAENELIKLDEVEYKLSQQLSRLANDIRNEIQANRDKDYEGKKAVGNWFVRQELSAWETVLNVQAYSQCAQYTDDNEDYY